MRWKDITEAPLAGYELHGDWSDTTSHEPKAVKQEDLPDVKGKNSFVSKYDRALLQSPKTEQALQKVFAKFDIPFYLYVLNAKGGLKIAKRFLDYGILQDVPNHMGVDAKKANDRSVLTLLGKTLTTVLASREDGQSIQIVLTHNEGGDQRHSLSPWLIVHRMVHATGNTWRYKLNREGSSFVTAVSGAYGFNRSATDMNKVLRQFCTFRSAREGNILAVSDGTNHGYELETELFTQFIYSGKVTLRAPDVLTITDRSGGSTVEYKRKKNVSVQELEDKINDIFIKQLEALKGKVMVC